MVDKEYIRKKHFVDGWSIREISRKCKISRQTIRKMLEDVEVPKYNLTVNRPRPVMERWIPVIEQWLREDERPGVPRKQKHTAVRIHERLKTEFPGEFDAAESTVRMWVRRLRNKRPEAYVPLASDAGELAQVDFGKATIRINGVMTEISLFVLRLHYSGVIYARAFSTEKLEAFLEGHRYAFEWLGGVPGSVRYDNPKTAVTKILAGPLREEHEMLSSLRAHYLFDSEFCRPGEPHEKGGVENGVGYVRRHVCVPVPEVGDLDEFNGILQQWCDKQREKRQSEWIQDQQQLRPLPVRPHRCATSHAVVVNKLCLVTYDRNRYSVPSHYVGKTLLLRAYAERVEILERDRVVATHTRRHERGQTILELEHYLPVLVHKPHAVTHAAVVRQMPEMYQQIRRRMTQSRPDGYKDFLSILLLHQSYSANDILNAIESIRPEYVTAEQIRAHIERRVSTTSTVPNELLDYRLKKQNPGKYDLLATGVIH
jgi:transposase